VPLIKHLIATASDILYRLNSEIDQLQTTLQKLERERDLIQHHIDAHEGLLSPTRRLPAEILSEIFSHCLPTDRNPTCSQSDAPLLLGQVCKDWRQVSLSTPYLWASIHIVIPLNARARVLHPLIDAKTKGIESWLSRSGSLPLSISVYAVEPAVREYVAEGPALRGPVQSLLDRVLQRSSRWYAVDFKITTACISILGESWPWGGNKDFPRLRTFRLSRQWFTDTKFAWSQLTQLELQSDPSLSAVVRVLSQCRGLQSLTISNITIGEDFPAQVHTISLPSLKSLSLQSSICLSDKTNPVDACNIFCYLDAPVLRCLRVDIPYPRSDDFRCIPFVSLLAPGNQIEQLDIGIPSTTSASMLLDTLVLLPNLITAHIRHSFLDDSFLHRLTPSRDIHLKPLCPSLKHLYLLDNRPVVHDNDLLDLVHSRRNAIPTPFQTASDSLPSKPATASLDTFHVTLNRFQQIPDLQDQLQVLRDQGMDIIFAYCSKGLKRNPSYGQASRNNEISPDIDRMSYLEKVRNDEIPKHSWWS
jgi:hypothetical protein